MAATKKTTRTRAKRAPRPHSSGGPLDKAAPVRKEIRKELDKFKSGARKRTKAPPPPPGPRTFQSSGPFESSDPATAAADFGAGQAFSGSPADQQA
jgi:hypothetical protein